ncbi:alanine glycine permease [Litorimonas cladophorae]|uniref:Alanine glycine permease n=2 Tax=Litorimonas cladophorae TaxID=1220491 RepID=A0A918KUU8_9PROT|nr:alanine/glycine:cation symporter family protein [Litorimonas cladophorae]GGX74697.1 alanine glycine permease [Litorimonas cladophorae]
MTRDGLHLSGNIGPSRDIDRSGSNLASFWLRVLLMISVAFMAVPASAAGIDEAINANVQPITDKLSAFIFYSVRIGTADVPLIVCWLIFGAVFFTGYLGFINVRGFKHAVNIVRGKFADPLHEGEISHFQALTAAVSGTVGIGNIAGVAITVSAGGPGAIFWLIVAGLIGMTTKFVECTLGVKYRQKNADGSVSGGPMYYLKHGLAKRGMTGFGKFLGMFYAISIVIGCLGIGNMFQSNQAYVQLLQVTGGEAGALADKGWLVGLILAVVVGAIVIGGIKSIARVTVRLVPFMILLYIIGAIIVIAMNGARVPAAIASIFVGAFTMKGVTGGVLGIMIIGFQRAAFSNEAGIGSAAIAHSAVKTNEPLTEGFVSLLEPFIDTVVICTLTGLVLLTAFPTDYLMGGGVAGIELTSSAFENSIPWSPVPLSFAAIMFAFSTMLAWAYYGTKAWTYIFGQSKNKERVFSFIFCIFIVIGAAVKLEAILDFADALIFVMAIPNLIGLYIMAPEVKADLKVYWDAKDKAQKIARENTAA